MIYSAGEDASAGHHGEPRFSSARCSSAIMPSIKDQRSEKLGDDEALANRIACAQHEAARQPTGKAGFASRACTASGRWQKLRFFRSLAAASRTIINGPAVWLQHVQRFANVVRSMVCKDRRNARKLT